MALLDASATCMSSHQCQHRVGVHGAPWLWPLRGDVVDGGVGDLSFLSARSAPGAGVAS
jgi:hypothetical protein